MLSVRFFLLAAGSSLQQTKTEGNKFKNLIRTCFPTRTPHQHTGELRPCGECGRPQHPVGTRKENRKLTILPPVRGEVIGGGFVRGKKFAFVPYATNLELGPRLERVCYTVRQTPGKDNAVNTVNRHRTTGPSGFRPTNPAVVCICWSVRMQFCVDVFLFPSHSLSLSLNLFCSQPVKVV